MTLRLVLALSSYRRRSPRPRPPISLAAPCPPLSEGWSIELVAQAPQIVFPTAIVAAPDGTVYLGSDPMDMPGPPTEPIDRVMAIREWPGHGFRRQALERDGAGVGRWDSLCGPRTVPVGTS